LDSSNKKEEFGAKDRIGDFGGKARVGDYGVIFWGKWYTRWGKWMISNGTEG